jgi:hypothetical protein
MVGTAQRRLCPPYKTGRHCEEPTGRANARPMINSATKQSILSLRGMDCFASLAMTEEQPPFRFTSSSPGLSRPSTSLRRCGTKNVDARHKAGHDECVLCRPSQNTPPRSRRPIRARFSKTSRHLKSEGAGKCRGRAAPAVSCARLCKETHTSIQVQRRHPGIPCAMVLRPITRSPRRRIPFATVIRGLKACGKPGRARKPPRT